MVWAHVADPRFPRGYWACAVHMAPNDPQVRALLVPRFVAAAADQVDPFVIGGDFNATPDNDALEEIRDALSSRRPLIDSFDEAGTGDSFTVPQYHPDHRIDYVFHSAEWKATRCFVVANDDSAHRSVVADLVPAALAATGAAAAAPAAPAAEPVSLLGVAMP